MQLQTVLCYTYDMIFITELLKSNINFTASQSVPQWKFGAHTWFHRMNMIKWMVFSVISNKLQKYKCCSSIWYPTFRDWYWFLFNVNIFMEVNSAKKLSDFLKCGELDDCRFLFEIHVWCTEESQRIIHSEQLVSGPAFELSISWIQGRNGNSERSIWLLAVKVYYSLMCN
jgi:hypothetical protein